MGIHLVQADQVIVHRPLDWRIEVLADIDTQHTLELSCLDPLEQAIDTMVVETHAVDHRLGLRQTKQSRLGVARLRTRGNGADLDETEAELGEYFSGCRKQFSVALHTPTTPFQAAVWQALQSIPYGKTVSYQEQANRIGKPTAVRAVANANGANRVSIIIPCHRVIGSDGSLTGYAGGLQRKQWLLAHERGELPNSQDLFGESLF